MLSVVLGSGTTVEIVGCRDSNQGKPREGKQLGDHYSGSKRGTKGPGPESGDTQGRERRTAQEWESARTFVIN